jgi:hypothetical protein
MDQQARPGQQRSLASAHDDHHQGDNQGSSQEREVGRKNDRERRKGCRACHQETAPNTAKGHLKTRECPLQDRQRVS